MFNHAFSRGITVRCPRFILSFVAAFVLLNQEAYTQDPFAMEAHSPRDISTPSRVAVLGENGIDTFTEKTFTQAQAALLTERGEPVTYTPQNSGNFDYIGMPVGGIGAGQLYLGGDGKLWWWTIFNKVNRTSGENAHRNPYKRSKSSSHYNRIQQGFLLQVDGYPDRTLDRDGYTDITFQGQYPVGHVAFADEAHPLEINLVAFSPFIPLDLENSSYPATFLEYTITNTGESSVSGSLTGWLENAVNYFTHDDEGRTGQWHNTFTQETTPFSAIQFYFDQRTEHFLASRHGIHDSGYRGRCGEYPCVHGL